MQRTIAVACSLLLAGCATLPSKPVVESGQLDLSGPPETWHVLAGLTDGSDSIHSAMLEEYDKAQCFKPKAWELEKAYVKLLEDYAKRMQALQRAK